MITYKLEVDRLNCVINENGLTNVVKSITWKYYANNETDTVMEIGSIQVSSPITKNFISSEDITKEIAAKWVINVLSKKTSDSENSFTKLEILRKRLDERLERKLATISIIPKD